MIPPQPTISASKKVHNNKSLAENLKQLTSKSVAPSQLNNLTSKLIGPSQGTIGHSKKLSKAEISNKFLQGVKGQHQHQHSLGLQSGNAMMQTMKVNAGLFYGQAGPSTKKTSEGIPRKLIKSTSHI